MTRVQRQFLDMQNWSDRRAQIEASKPAMPAFFINREHHEVLLANFYEVDGRPGLHLFEYSVTEYEARALADWIRLQLSEVPDP